MWGFTDVLNVLGQHPVAFSVIAVSLGIVYDAIEAVLRKVFKR